MYNHHWTELNQEVLFFASLVMEQSEGQSPSLPSYWSVPRTAATDHQHVERSGARTHAEQ
jgi:hypothetical protein